MAKNVTKATIVKFFTVIGFAIIACYKKELVCNVFRGREYIPVGGTIFPVISNVPSAILLAGFSENNRELLLGVIGTLIASPVSLISYKTNVENILLQVICSSFI